MSFLVRKITRSKWGDCSSDESLQVNGDALTNCLKTTFDTLSVWRAVDKADLPYAKYALIGTLQRLEKIDIVILEEADLAAEHIKLVESPGNTAASSLVDRHRDLSELTIPEMAKVARLIQLKLVAGETERLGKAELKALFGEAIEKGILLPAALNEDIRKALSLP